MEFDIVNFLNSDTDSDEERSEKTNGHNLYSEKLSEIVQLQIQNGLSFRATNNVVKYVNNLPNTGIRLPLHKKTIAKHTQSEIDYKILLYCEKCEEIFDQNSRCTRCQSTAKKNSKQNNFLVYFPFESQVLRLLNKYFDEIMKHLNRESGEEVLRDIDDGYLYRKKTNKKQQFIDITFTLNADGAKIYNSSKSSLWPLQLYANFLPPSVRFLSENIIVSTLYYGHKKPNMMTLLYTLAEEVDNLCETLICLYKENEFFNFRPSIFLCSCDLPARADIQGLIGPTGKYGCPFCYHPGIPVKNLSGRTTVRYIKAESPYRPRTHNETVIISQRDEIAKGSENINGIKKTCAMLLFDDIDMIDSFPIDYMHNLLLGIMKDLIEIWIGKKRIPSPPYKDYKIKNNNARKLLANRILKLKPTVDFGRLPRSIFEIGYFKAAELMNFMWYYLRYTLVGLLPSRVINNFEKLSVGSYILCKKEIPLSEVRVASEMLIKFADEFEQIYGSGAVTMNVHLLRHYHDVIINCGPLWSYSLFGFENNIGRLKRYVCGTTDVLSQIAWKYVHSLNIDSDKKNENEAQNNLALYQKSKISVEPEYANVLMSCKVISNEQESLVIWRRIRLNGIIYTSSKSVLTRTADFFVRMTNKHVGKIVFFFGSHLKPKILLQVYEETYKNFHWTEVKKLDLYEIHKCEYIEEKLLYFHSGNIEYVTKKPNPYGRGEYDIICFLYDKSLKP